jgi:hypothetical protein
MFENQTRTSQIESLGGLLPIIYSTDKVKFINFNWPIFGSISKIVFFTTRPGEIS